MPTTFRSPPGLSRPVLQVSALPPPLPTSFCSHLRVIWLLVQTALKRRFLAVYLTVGCRVAVDVGKGHVVLEFSKPVPSPADPAAAIQALGAPE
eukprot:1025879-Rhodomonas_salina.1